MPGSQDLSFRTSINGHWVSGPRVSGPRQTDSWDLGFRTSTDGQTEIKEEGNKYQKANCTCVSNDCENR